MNFEKGVSSFVELQVV